MAANKINLKAIKAAEEDDRRRGFQRNVDLHFDDVFEYDHTPPGPDFVPSAKYPLKNLEKYFRPTFATGLPGVYLTEEEKTKLRQPDGKPGVLPDQVVKDVFEKPRYYTYASISEFEKRRGIAARPEELHPKIPYVSRRRPRASQTQPVNRPENKEFAQEIIQAIKGKHVRWQ